MIKKIIIFFDLVIFFGVIGGMEQNTIDFAKGFYICCGLLVLLYICKLPEVHDEEV